jgi:hypothetical protein
MGEMTSLKQGSQREELISSGPHETSESFSHSLPHLTHLTRSLFTPQPCLSNRSRFGEQHNNSWSKKRQEINLIQDIHTQIKCLFRNRVFSAGVVFGKVKMGGSAPMADMFVLEKHGLVW